MEISGQSVSLCFKCPVNCDKISLNIGKHFGRVLKDFKINIEDTVISIFPGISIFDYKVFDYDDLVIYLKGDFSEKQKIYCSFKMPKMKDVEVQKLMEGLVEQYYYNKIVNENKIVSLDYISEDLVKRLGEAKKYDYLQKSPLFWRIKPLCERQDLKAKIIKKLIIKFINE